MKLKGIFFIMLGALLSFAAFLTLYAFNAPGPAIFSLVALGCSAWFIYDGLGQITRKVDVLE